MLYAAFTSQSQNPRAQRNCVLALEPGEDFAVCTFLINQSVWLIDLCLGFCA